MNQEGHREDNTNALRKPEKNNFTFLFESKKNNKQKLN